MSKTWQVQDAKARFSELLETSLAEGPPDRDQTGAWRRPCCCPSTSGDDWRSGPGRISSNYCSLQRLARMR